MEPADSTNSQVSFKDQTSHTSNLVKRLLDSAISNNGNDSSEAITVKTIEGDPEWKNLKEQDRLRHNTKIIEIQIEAYALDLISDKEGNAEKLNKVIDIAVVLADKECVEASFPHALLETILDSSSISNIKIIFEHIKRTDYFLMKDLPTNSGKGQIFLRVLNNLQKRIPRYTDSQFRGQTMEFFSLLFKMNDRSGINLKGEFDTSINIEYENFELETQNTTEPAALSEPSQLEKKPTEVKKEVGTEIDNTNEAVGTKSGEIHGDVVPKQEDLKDAEITNATTDKHKETPALELDVSEDVAQNIRQNTESISDIDATSQNPMKRKRYDMISPELKSFYKLFWGLQEYLKAPHKAFEDGNATKVFEGLKKTLAKLGEGDRSKPQKVYYADILKGGIGFDRNEPDLPLLYLTAPELFERQFLDPRFRFQTLLQILIFCKHCLTGTKESVDSLMAIPSMNKSVIPGFRISEDEATGLSDIRRMSLALLESNNISKGEIRKSILYALQSENYWVNWKNKMCKTEERLPRKDLKEKIDFVQAEIYTPSQTLPKNNQAREMKLPLFIQELDKAPVFKNRLDLGPKIVPKPKKHLQEMDKLMANSNLATSEELQARFELERWKAVRSTIFESMSLTQKELSRDLKELR